MTATLAIDDQSVELTVDSHGLVGHVDIDGVRHVVHCTVTPTGRPAATPAKWVQRN